MRQTSARFVVTADRSQYYPAMPKSMLILTLIWVAGLNACDRMKSTALAASGTSTNQQPPSIPKPAKVNFASDVKPILQSRCQPCHFEGGQMYENLPFDKPETITKLGTKLFTRIKNEDERRVISEFLAKSFD
jgi:hypothetical protein